MHHGTTGIGRRRAHARAGAGLAGVLAGVLLLAGCGSGGAAGGSSAGAPGAGQGGGASGQGDGASGQGAQEGAGGGQGAFPGAGGGVSGLVAAISGTTMQVQSDVQTAVSWTDATTVSRVVTTDLAGVTVGSCVVAFSTDDAAEATSVTVSAPVDGACTGPGVGGFPDGQWSQGQGPQGEGPAGERPSGMPSGMPSDLPSGMPSGGFGGSVVAGQVTAVDGSSLTVDQDGTAATVQVGSGTTVTTTQAADAAAIAVGMCVSARGEADERGAVTATSLTLSDAVDGACTRRGGPRG